MAAIIDSYGLRRGLKTTRDNLLRQGDSVVNVLKVRGDSFWSVLKEGNDVTDHISIESWSTSRRNVGLIVGSRLFDGFMGCVILLNIFVAIVETDRRSVCEDTRSSECSANDADVRIPGIIMLFIYCFELGLRLFVFRGRFARDSWNLFDAFVVSISLIGETFGGAPDGLAWVRIIRVARLVRIFRLITMFRTLYLIVNGFVDTMKTIVWALVLLFLLLTMFSLIAVDFIQPVNKLLIEEGVYSNQCDRCAIAYSTVWESFITLVQTLILGDEWGTLTIPLMMRSTGACIFFFAILAIVFLGFSNVIISVIVEQAAEAREIDDRYQAMVRKAEEDILKVKLRTICQEVDTDKSGTIEADELMTQFEKNPKFKNNLRMLDVEVDDLKLVMSIMDKDRDANVSYEEFISTLIKLKFMDTCTLLTFIKYHVVKIRDDLKKEMNYTKRMVRILTGKMDFVMATSSTYSMFSPSTSFTGDIPGLDKGPSFHDNSDCESDSPARDENLDLEGAAAPTPKSPAPRVKGGLEFSENRSGSFEHQYMGKSSRCEVEGANGLRAWVPSLPRGIYSVAESAASVPARGAQPQSSCNGGGVSFGPTALSGIAASSRSHAFGGVDAEFRNLREQVERQLDSMVVRAVAACTSSISQNQVRVELLAYGIRTLAQISDSLPRIVLESACDDSPMSRDTSCQDSVPPVMDRPWIVPTPVTERPFMRPTALVPPGVRNLKTPSPADSEASKASKGNKIPYNKPSVERAI